MQRAIITILFLIFALGALAQSNGDTLYVAAHSGLNLRTAPGTKAPKLTVIPKGGQVTILADVDSSLAHSVAEFPGFNVKGFWVEVDYSGQVGFVFSGYLSGFKPFSKDDINGKLADPFYAYMNGPLYYLWQNYKLQNSVHYSIGYVQDTCYRNWSSPFADGITYRIRGACGESDGRIILEFENHSLQEVYLLYLLYKGAYNIKQGKLNWDKKNGFSDDYYPEDGGWSEDHIYSEDDKIIWVSFGGC